MDEEPMDIVTNFGRKLRNLEEPKGEPERYTERLEFRTSPQQLARLDKVRGKESRGSFVRHLIDDAARRAKWWTR